MSDAPSPSTAPPPASRPSPARQVIMAMLALVVIGGAGWNVWRQFDTPRGYRFDHSKPYPFRDDVVANATPAAEGFTGLAFVDAAGEPVDLDRYRGAKNVVLVVTRGNTSGLPPEMHTGTICLYCASQTARLVANYDAIAAHDAEVVVVFPVAGGADAPALEAFRAAVAADAARHDAKPAAAAPFPVVLDVGLAAVDRLGLRADLSRPATYVIDKEGRVRFAYVGESAADRPSVKAILGQLAGLAPKAP